MEKAIILFCIFAVGFGLGSVWMADKCKNVFARILTDIEEEIKNQK